MGKFCLLFNISACGKIWHRQTDDIRDNQIVDSGMSQQKLLLAHWLAAWHWWWFNTRACFELHPLNKSVQFTTANRRRRVEKKLSAIFLISAADRAYIAVHVELGIIIVENACTKALSSVPTNNHPTLFSQVVRALQRILTAVCVIISACLLPALSLSLPTSSHLVCCGAAQIRCECVSVHSSSAFSTLIDS